MRTWALGVDLEQEQANIEAADAGNGALNRQAWEDGRWTDQEYDEARQRMEDGKIDVVAEVGEEWWAGYNDAADNLTGGLRRGLAEPVNLVLRALPWWVWVALVAWVAWQLGLWRRLKNSLA